MNNRILCVAIILLSIAISSVEAACPTTTTLPHCGGCAARTPMNTKAYCETDKCCVWYADGINPAECVEICTQTSYGVGLWDGSAFVPKINTCSGTSLTQYTCNFENLVTTTVSCSPNVCTGTVSPYGFVVGSCGASKCTACAGVCDEVTGLCDVSSGPTATTVPLTQTMDEFKESSKDTGCLVYCISFAIFAGLLTVTLLFCGVRYISAESAAARLEARNTIIYILVGALVMVLAFPLVNGLFSGTVLGTTSCDCTLILS